MSKMNRIWAENGDVTDPGLAKYDLGWVAQIPTFQDFNFILKNITLDAINQRELPAQRHDPELTYIKGTSVMEGGKTFYCRKDTSLNVPPSSDPNHVHWVSLPQYGKDIYSHQPEHGFVISNDLENPTTKWLGQELTLENDTVSSINFTLSNPFYDNLLLSNLKGELVLTNTKQVVDPDGRFLDNTWRVYHEGYKPHVRDVKNAVEEVPSDSKEYIRMNGHWKTSKLEPVVMQNVADISTNSGKIVTNSQDIDDLRPLIQANTDGIVAVNTKADNNRTFTNQVNQKVDLNVIEIKRKIYDAPNDGQQYERKHGSWIKAKELVQAPLATPNIIMNPYAIDLVRNGGKTRWLHNGPGQMAQIVEAWSFSHNQVYILQYEFSGTVVNKLIRAPGPGTHWKVVVPDSAVAINLREWTTYAPGIQQPVMPFPTKNIEQITRECERYIRRVAVSGSEHGKAGGSKVTMRTPILDMRANPTPRVLEAYTYWGYADRPYKPGSKWAVDHSRTQFHSGIMTMRLTMYNASDIDDNGMFFVDATILLNAEFNIGDGTEGSVL